MANELFPGSQTVLFAEREATYGTARRIAGADAFLTMSESLTPAEERDVRPDRSGFADHVERYVGRKSAEWEISKLLVPSGSVTTEPDDGILWQNAFGRLSMGTTAMEYVLATAHNWALTIRRAIRTGGGAGVAEFQEHVRGAIVNSMEMAWGSQGQNGLATVTFRGPAKDWGWTGNTSIGSGYITMNTGKSTFRVSAPKQLSPNSLVVIRGTDTGGGSGILISSINYTNSVVTISSSTARTATASSGRTIVPYNPTATTAGSPIHARVGFLSLDGSATKIDHLGGRITLEDNRELLNEEVGYDSPSRVLRSDRRNVTFSLDFMVKKDEVGELLGEMHRNTAQNIQVNIGDVQYKTVKVHMKNAEWDMSAVEIPDQGMMRISMAGRALGTAGNDSLRVRFM